MKYLPSSRGNQLLAVTRKQVLFTSAITFCASFLCFLPDFPFHPGFCKIAIISSVYHFLLFLMFRFVTPQILNLSNLFNFVLLGFSIHFTGGILSPFNLIFVCILIAGSDYGAKYLVAIVASLGMYLFIVGSEYFGVLQPIDISPKKLYGSDLTTLLVIFSTVGFMLTAGSIYKVTVKRLREKSEEENRFKESMMKKLSRLDAPSQVGLVVNKIVHDVRGPLGAISGFIKLLKQENKLKPESKEDCDVMLTELARISKLLTRMTQYTKPSHMKNETLCVVSLLEGVLSVLRFFPGIERVSIRKSFLAPNKFMIYGSKEELQQVYFNILKNAIEALQETHRSPRLFISTEWQDGKICILISDNGPGMDKKKIRDLLTVGSSTKKDGVGLGLVIVKEILEAHDGELIIESKLGIGTKVITRFPVFEGVKQKDEKYQNSKKGAVNVS